jgi:hypothetical protein
MEKVTKAQVIDNLTVEWTEWRKRMESLSEESGKSYCTRQGFPGRIALVAHIVAWWDDACKNIARLRDHPEWKPPDQDVDAFNADVVKASAGKSLPEVVAEFETARTRLLQLVAALDEGDLENPEIQKELFWDVTNHYRDHRIE